MLCTGQVHIVDVYLKITLITVYRIYLGQLYPFCTQLDSSVCKDVPTLYMYIVSYYLHSVSYFLHCVS